MNTTNNYDAETSSLPRWLNELLAWQPDAESVSELLERAEAYEDSQPSYAADLRAAAELASAEQ